MLKIFVKLVVLIIAVGAGRFAYEKTSNLPLFALDEVHVSSNGYFDPDTIAAIGGLEKGKSIFKQDMAFSAEMISRQNGVISCMVDRGFISDVNVDIKIAEPMLLISGSKVFGLSKEGIVLPVNESTPDLPLITGRKFRNARLYGHIEDPDIAYALEFYNELKSASPGLVTLLSEINFSGNNVIKTYFSPDGTSVLLDKNFSGRDLFRLCALEKTGNLRGRRIFDLRFGDIVVESTMNKGSL